MIAKLYQRYQYRCLLEEYLIQGPTPRDFIVRKAAALERITCLAISVIAAMAALLSPYYYQIFRESWSTFYQGNKIFLKKNEEGTQHKSDFSIQEQEYPVTISTLTSAGESSRSEEAHTSAHEIDQDLWVAGDASIDLAFFDLYGDRKVLQTSSIGLVMGFANDPGLNRNYIDLSTYQHELGTHGAYGSWVSLVQEMVKARRANQSVMIITQGNEDIAAFLMLSYLGWRDQYPMDLSAEVYLNRLKEKRVHLCLSPMLHRRLCEEWTHFKDSMSANQTSMRACAKVFMEAFIQTPDEMLPDEKDFGAQDRDDFRGEKLFQVRPSHLDVLHSATSSHLAASSSMRLPKRVRVTPREE